MRPGVQNREEERGAGGGLQELGLRGPRRGATGAPGSTAAPTRNTKEWGESARPARGEHTAVLVARLSSQLRGRALRPFCEELQRKCGTTNELGHFKGDRLFQVQTCGDTLNEKGVFHRPRRMETPTPPLRTRSRPPARGATHLQRSGVLFEGRARGSRSENRKQPRQSQDAPCGRPRTT